MMAMSAAANTNTHSETAVPSINGHTICLNDGPRRKSAALHCDNSCSNANGANVDSSDDAELRYNHSAGAAVEPLITANGVLMTE